MQHELDNNVRILQSEIYDSGIIVNLKKGNIVKLRKKGINYILDYLENKLIQDPAIDTNDIHKFLEDNHFLKEDVGIKDEIDKGIWVKSATIELTYRCNLNCLTCFQSKEHNQISELSKEQWFRVMNNLKSNGIKALCFMGGEPLVRTDIMEIVAYAKKLDFKTSIITNGLKLDNKNIDHLKSLELDTIQISLDSLDKETYERQRVGGSFDIIMSNLDNLSKNGFKNIHLSPTITKLNYNELIGNKFKQFALTHGFSLSYSPLIITGNAGNNSSDLSMTYDEKYKYIDHIRKSDNSKSDKEVLSNISLKKVCGAGITKITIAPDGAIYPCYLLEEKEFKYNMSALDDNLSIQDVSMHYRNIFLDVEKYDQCKSCNVRYFCGGFCRASAKLNGNLHGPHQDCKLSKRLLEESIFIIKG